MDEMIEDEFIKEIEELISYDLKRDGYWFVFHRLYKEFLVFKKPVPTDFGRFCVESEYIDVTSDYIDLDARQEFLSFMAQNFPNVKVYRVTDVVPLGMMSWPYLGSIAIDIQKGDPAYQALSAKYGDPEQAATDNRHVFWVMDYATALKTCVKRKAFWDETFDDDD